MQVPPSPGILDAFVKSKAFGVHIGKPYRPPGKAPERPRGGAGGLRGRGQRGERAKEVRASTGQLSMEIIGTKPHRLHF